MRRRISWAGVVVACSVMAACVPQPGGPSRPDASIRPQSIREVLTRDVDNPPRLDCENWRYGPADPDTLPEDFNPRDYKQVSTRDPNVARSQQRLCGQRGPALDLAWGVTHGRDDVMTAVLDSGINWYNEVQGEDLAERSHVNVGEVPTPQGSATHDANGDGIVSASDWADDPRVGDRNGTGFLDPQDLILAFSDGTDADGNGYVDDISGWDFQFGDNDPFDNVRYNHGTGMAADAVASDGGGSDVGVCFECRVLHVRVGDSFIVDGARFAAGVLFSVDSGAASIQEALGAISNPEHAQRAIDAAVRRGVPIAASMADEASQHPNLPAALERTIPVNSITKELGPLSSVAEALGGESDYLSLNGCTNYGGITWVAVASDACSSEASSRAGGNVALMISAARDGGVARHPGIVGDGAGPLSANEIKQLLRATADDIDFSSPGTSRMDRPNNSGNRGFDRYPTRAGWDITFGFGRVNIYEAVRAAHAGEIPPEADIFTPGIYEVLPTSGSVPVNGAVAAVRSGSYSYKVQWAPGVQAPAWPGRDDWRTLADVAGQTAPRSGALATLDLGQVAAALPNGGRGPSEVDGIGDEDRFAARIRIVVTDAEGRTGVALKQIFVHEDPDRVVQRRVPSAGTASPAHADLDGNGTDELILPTDDGTVHAFTADGTELAGWPVRTGPAAWWPTGSATARADGIGQPNDLIGVGAPVVADLDDDGFLEVAVTDVAGHVSVWNRTGDLVFRAAVDPRLSPEAATSRVNRLKPGFLAAPAAGDLDGDGDLELVAAAMDRHVYAWHHDGAPVDGFPVLVVDPARVQSVDPVNRSITFRGDLDGVGDGGELIVTPTVADLTGDGRAEIVVGPQEQYKDETVGVFPPVGIPGLSGNTRLYAIWGDGAAHQRTGADRHPQHPHDQAYLPGWPVKLPMVVSGVLPLIGNGVNIQAVVGNLDRDPAPEIAAASSAGPLMVFDVDGRTPVGREFGVQVAPEWLGENRSPNANTEDGGIRVAAFGGPSLGDMTGDGRLDVAMPTVGLIGALDRLLPGFQPGHNHMSIWNMRTQTLTAGSPRQIRDLAFFSVPALVDVDDDGDLDVALGHGVSLIESTDARGDVAPGWPKLTGGWVVGTPSFGDRDGSGRAEMATVRRDGWLQIWDTQARTERLGDGWPRWGNDGTNSGDARR